VQQEVVLAMLVKEPSQGSQLRARLDRALGPLGEAVNDGQIYVTLNRLEKAGFITRQVAGTPSADRKVYQLTPVGQERVTDWMSDVSWPKPNLAEFHLKLIAAAQAGLAAPRAFAPAPRGATGGDGRTRSLRRRAAARRHRASPPG
jgi:DNA-binding PadR family transcriptional regulator